MAVLASIEREFRQFSRLVYDVLRQYSGSTLSAETVEGLLKQEGNANLSEMEQNAEMFPTTVNSYGYPTYPLYTQVSRNLYDWMKNGKSKPFCATKTLLLLNESRDQNEKQAIWDFVDIKLKAYLLTDEIFTQKILILEILETLKLRGILDLLGMRQTVGSLDIFPPALLTLQESFKKKHKPNSELSCGARALSKHCHRDSTSQWWGSSTGSESNKNQHANQVLDKILTDSTWINIHLLPHNVKVLEVRNCLGYGARWLLEGMTFRGFLEPQMDNGHSVHWRH